MARDVTVIVKVTNACNMQCRYCFIEPSIFHRTMRDDLATRVVDAFLGSEAFSSVHFVWHGGEPLLRGRGFFERVFAAQAAHGGRVSFMNSTQTNATRLDDDLLDFLLAHDVGIGLSLDGPPSANDASRRGRRLIPVASAPVADPSRGGAAPVTGAGCAGGGDRSAHAVTVDAAARLQRRGRAAGAIVTVNRHNVADPVGVYRELRDRGIHMKVNPLTRSGLADTPLGADLGVTAEEYGEFLVGVFDAWFDDPEPAITVDPLGQHVARILGDPVTHNCFYTRSCHRWFLGVSPDGDLFPCGMFQGEPAFRYGNIADLSPQDVAGTVLFGQLEAREEHVLADCARCAFVDLCYGGCMFHSLKDARVVAEKDYYCAGYKRYFEHALRRIRADLGRAVALPR